jgi:prolyl 4-hydroxylase
VNRLAPAIPERRTVQYDRKPRQIAYERVMARFATDDEMLVLRGRGLNLFLRRDFLSPDECAELISAIDGARRDALVAPRAGYAGDGVVLSLDRCNLLAAVSRRMDALLGLEAHNGEEIIGHRHAPGRQDPPRFDWFDPRGAEWPVQSLSGGQRTWSAVIDLNAPVAGGTTLFLHGGMRVRPQAGTLLAWPNCGADGRENVMAMYAPQPVTMGVKYMLAKCYREHPVGRGPSAVQHTPAIDHDLSA